MNDLFVTSLIILIACIGHAGAIVGLYNVVNATGIKRTTIKLIEKFILAAGVSIPVFLVANEYVQRGSLGFVPYEELQSLTQIYLAAASLFALIAAPFWIDARPWFSLAHHRAITVDSKLHRESPKTDWVKGTKFRTMAKLPRNEITWTEVNHKQILLSALPEPLHGMRIGHLSDVHLMGEMDHRFYWRALEWIQSMAPDLIVLSGDIVDYEHALDDIQPIFSSLRAPIGKCFLLGNHDRRLRDPLQVCRRLTDLGWMDVGHSEWLTEFRGVPIQVMGNELPWFNRTTETTAIAKVPKPLDPTQIWRLGVAHSPDQFRWASRIGCQLLLCGHTHGGQIRFPGIGPLVAPSWFGSRFASGVFEKSGTIMHVSRGLSGVHPYRWGCPPEVSILELKALG
jgi:predicted MPP superfamily phosphohydrolase